jgi:hypothetical protein
VHHLDLAVDALAHVQRVDDPGQVVVAEPVGSERISPRKSGA